MCCCKASPQTPMQPIPILTYHQIAEAPAKGAPFRSLYVSPQAFVRQMWVMKLLGYRGLGMDALLPYLHGERRGRVFGITFDDGYCNNLLHALPVLQRLGFSSTCYVVSDLVGKTNLWDAPIGIAQVPLMRREDMRAWLQGGQEIGAHTRSHAHLPQISAQEAEAEIGGCKQDLEAMLQVPVRHFCYPYGQYEKRHVEQVQSAGYVSATTTRRGRAQSQAPAPAFAQSPSQSPSQPPSLLELPRVPVLRSTSLPVFLHKLLSAYEDRKA